MYSICSMKNIKKNLIEAREKMLLYTICVYATTGTRALNFKIYRSLGDFVGQTIKRIAIGRQIFLHSNFNAMKHELSHSDCSTNRLIHIYFRCTLCLEQQGEEDFY
jgi:hypothetical protein